MNRIESPSNPRVKTWAALQTAKGRRATGTFLLEGPHLVQAALAAGADVREVLLRDDEDAPAWMSVVPTDRIVRVSDRVLRAVCEAKTPQAIAAVCARPSAWDAGEIALPAVLLDGVQDPGNVGTIIRTADAAGMRTVLLGSGCADPLAPRTVRATQGSLFHTAVREVDAASVLPALIDDGIDVIAADLDGEDFEHAAPPANGRWVLVVGNEGAGIGPEVRRLCTRALTIPIRGRAESLSVGIATGILLYHLTRGGSR